MPVRWVQDCDIVHQDSARTKSPSLTKNHAQATKGEVAGDVTCKDSTIPPMLNVSSIKKREKMMLHTKSSKLDYVQAKKKDYRKARRRAKTKLLAEVVALTGYTRPYAASLLRSHHDLTKPKPKTKHLRARLYGPESTDVDRKSTRLNSSH